MSKSLYSDVRRILKIFGIKGLPLLLLAVLFTLAITVYLATFAPVPTTVPVDNVVSSLATVVSVIDGDTIKVDTDSGSAEQLETVRLIGIDAPELAKARVAAECKAPESTAYLKALIGTNQLRLEADPTQTDRDRYGRLLRFVFAGERDLNLEMLKAGLAKEYTYDKAYRYQGAYRQAQLEAQAARIGVWSAECAAALN
jgi:micrococcal nuclease